MNKAKLPDNWQLTRVPNGDTVLHRWETRTFGHLWWKKEVSGWQYIRSFTGSTVSTEAEWAIDVEQKMSETEGWDNFYHYPYPLHWFDGQGPGSL